MPGGGWSIPAGRGGWESVLFQGWEFGSPRTRSDRAEPCPCDSRERQCSVTSLGKQCHTSQGRQRYIPWNAEPRPCDSRLRQCSVTFLGKQCHVLAKELSHPKEGRAGHPEAWRHFQLCPSSSHLPSSPGSPYACLDCAQCPAPAALIFWEKLFPADNDCSRIANDCSQMIMAVPSPAGHRAVIPLDKHTQSPRGEQGNDGVCHHPERNLLNSGHSRVSWIPEECKSTLRMVIPSGSSLVSIPVQKTPLAGILVIW